MKKKTVGVIVGRFEADRLTPGHVHLINTALLQNDTVLLFIGTGKAVNTRNYPIDFHWRQSMIQSDNRIFNQNRDLHILPVYDKGSNEVWSEALYKSISTLVDVNECVIRCYGSRDSSFLDGFQGNFEKVEILPLSEFSASERRKNISKMYPTGLPTDDFIRQGMIMAAYNRFPTVYSAVDALILDVRDGQDGFWMGRKPDQTQFRFIGGFAEPTSRNDEEDVAREVKEETGLIVNEIEYIGNTIIDDFRYRKEVDKIRSRFFVCRVIGGTPQAADDIAEIKFVPILQFAGLEVVPEHEPLKKMTDEWLTRGKGFRYFERIGHIYQ